MYEGGNAKALQSQRWLAESLVALMQKQRYEKITIQQICDGAGLSRQTFYNVFDSKEEILHFYLRDSYQAKFQALSGQKTLPVEDIVSSFIAVVSDTRPALDAMIANDLSGIIFDEVGSCIALFTGRFVAEDRMDELFPYNEAMLSGAVATLLIFWLKQNHPIDVSQLTEVLKNFLQGRAFRFPAGEES